LIMWVIVLIDIFAVLITNCL